MPELQKCGIHMTSSNHRELFKAFCLSTDAASRSAARQNPIGTVSGLFMPRDRVGPMP